MQRRSEPPDAPIVLRSPHRAVTAEDVTDIRDRTAQHPEWARHTLSLHLCQAWDWRRPDGTWYHRACHHLLGCLAAHGLLTLPSRQQQMLTIVIESARPQPRLPQGLLEALEILTEL